MYFWYLYMILIVINLISVYIMRLALVGEYNKKSWGYWPFLIVMILSSVVPFFISLLLIVVSGNKDVKQDIIRGFKLLWAKKPKTSDSHNQLILSDSEKEKEQSIIDDIAYNSLHLKNFETKVVVQPFEKLTNYSITYNSLPGLKGTVLLEYTWDGHLCHERYTINEDNHDTFEFIGEFIREFEDSIIDTSVIGHNVLNITLYSHGHMSDGTVYESGYFKIVSIYEKEVNLLQGLIFNPFKLENIKF